MRGGGLTCMQMFIQLEMITPLPPKGKQEELDNGDL